MTSGTGKLRDNRNDSGDDEEWQGSPHQKVERLCEEHFQVESMPAEAVAALLQVSPHADATSDNWTDDSYWLAASMAWDVIGAARARHYYTPTSDEEWDPRVGDQICARCGILACYHDASGVWEQPGAHPDNGCPAFVPPEAT